VVLYGALRAGPTGKTQREWDERVQNSSFLVWVRLGKLGSIHRGGDSHIVSYAENLSAP
jgi:hypothetical protein